VVGGRVLGEGTGRSKKVAEQQAASAAYEAIRAGGMREVSEE
jgi:dsRNA-specific ribonuclease